MTRALWLALAVALLGAVPASAADEFVPGEVVVRYTAGTDAGERREIRQENDVSVEDTLLLARTQLLEIEDGSSVRAAVRELEREPGVAFAEPNFLYELTALPNDTRFFDMWGLQNTGQTVNGAAGSFDADIDAPEAWDITTGSDNVVVGVVDSGIANRPGFGHPDLLPNRWTNPDEVAGNGLDDDSNGRVDDVRGYDFVDDDADPLDFNGHGTHVAGTIGAQGNNLGQPATDGTGVAWDAQLMALRACNGNGSCPSARVTDAFTYAGREGADVVNASLGSDSASQAQRLAIEGAPNTLFVIAAGNEGANNDTTPHFPCAHPSANIVCVAASTQSDGLAGFSNFGATSVDIAAPGVNVLSTVPAYDDITAEEEFTQASDVTNNWTSFANGGVAWGFHQTPPRNSLADSPGAGVEYANNSQSLVVRNSVSLAGEIGCAYDYIHRLDVEPPPENDDPVDLVRVLGSNNNGASFTILDELTEPTGTSFRFSHTDISSFDGAPNFRAGFRMVSDASVTDDGAYIDNFVIRCLSATFTSADDFDFKQGTSMASPHVAGVAALLVARDPDATPAELKEDLLDSAEPKPAFATTVASGGRLNAFRALTANRGVTVAQSGGNSGVAEGGAGDSYTVVLDRVPTANVTVTASSPGQVGVSPQTLTFTPANWDEPQTVNLSALDDSVFEGAHIGAVTHAVSSADPLYNGITAAGVSVSIADNDAPLLVAPPPPVEPADAVISGRPVRATRGGRVPVRIGCTGGAGTSCDGTLTLDSAGRVRLRAAQRRRLRLGRRTFAIPAGTIRTVKVRISRTSRKLLARRRSLRVRMSAALSNGSVARRTVLVRAPRR